MKQHEGSTTPPQIKRLAQIAVELEAGKHFPITRLTVVKNLCKDEDDALKFCTYLASLALAKLSMKCPSHIEAADYKRYCELLTASVAAVQQRLKCGSATTAVDLRKLLHTVRNAQNSCRDTKWASVRTIESTELLQGELALVCAVNPSDCSRIAYRAARNHAERYAPEFGTGLLPSSAPRLQEIIAFWQAESG